MGTDLNPIAGIAAAAPAPAAGPVAHADRPNIDAIAAATPPCSTCRRDIVASGIGEASAPPVPRSTSLIVVALPVAARSRGRAGPPAHAATGPALRLAAYWR